MIPLSYKRIIFKNNALVFSIKSGDYSIMLKDVFAMSYKKVTFKNYLTMLKGERMGLGILYIATKDAKKRCDIIQIRIPYKELLKIPKEWFDKIEMFEYGKYMKIYKIMYK